MKSWQLSSPDEPSPLASSNQPSSEAKLAFARNFEFKVPLTWRLAKPVPSARSATGKTAPSITTRLRLRFSLWQNHLPVDALPLEGWIELQLLSEQDLAALAF
jgi:hypothetical protein